MTNYDELAEGFSVPNLPLFCAYCGQPIEDQEYEWVSDPDLGMRGPLPVPGEYDELVAMHSQCITEIGKKEAKLAKRYIEAELAGYSKVKSKKDLKDTVKRINDGEPGVDVDVTAYFGFGPGQSGTMGVKDLLTYPDMQDVALVIHRNGSAMAVVEAVNGKLKVASRKIATTGQSCPRCDGSGKISKDDLPAGGQKVDETCQRCGGTGTDKWASKTAGTRIDQFRKIVDSWQQGEVDGQPVDATTASMVVQIYDALKPENQTKFESMSPVQMVDMGWKLVEKTKSGKTAAETYQEECPDCGAVLHTHGEKPGPGLYCPRCGWEGTQGRKPSKKQAAAGSCPKCGSDNVFAQDDPDTEGFWDLYCMDCGELSQGHGEEVAPADWPDNRAWRPDLDKTGKRVTAGTSPFQKRPVDELFPEGYERKTKGLCPVCEQPITSFRDALSEKEYLISGLCQKCMDDAFREKESKIDAGMEEFFGPPISTYTNEQAIQDGIKVEIGERVFATTNLMRTVAPGRGPAHEFDLAAAAQLLTPVIQEYNNRKDKNDLMVTTKTKNGIEVWAIEDGDGLTLMLSEDY